MQSFTALLLAFTLYLNVTLAFVSEPTPLPSLSTSISTIPSPVPTLEPRQFEPEDPPEPETTFTRRRTRRPVQQINFKSTVEIKPLELIRVATVTSNVPTISRFDTFSNPTPFPGGNADGDPFSQGRNSRFGEVSAGIRKVQSKGMALLAAAVGTVVVVICGL